MVRRILALGLLCGSLAWAQPANAQGLWFGGVGFGAGGFGAPGFFPSGFGYPGFYGGFAPVRYGYPLLPAPVYVSRPVYVARPVVAPVAVLPYATRPAVRAPLNRAYRRVWRSGW